jgi:Ni,Fe-hydrogenase I cytochrome b subunit
LRIEVKDIYFMAVLLRQGEVVNLKSWGDGSGMKIEEYIDVHYVAGTQKVENPLPIRAIKNISLNIVVLILNRIIGSTSLHHALRILILYFVECLRPIVYDWCTSLMDNMKGQLTE